LCTTTIVRTLKCAANVMAQNVFPNPHGSERTPPPTVSRARIPFWIASRWISLWGPADVCIFAPCGSGRVSLWAGSSGK
jgi:hypothetical protein